MSSMRSHHYRPYHHPYYMHHENHHPGTPSLTPGPPPPTPTPRRRKTHTMTTTNPRPNTKSNSNNRCWTWLLIPSGNMHWAKNRSAFSTYRRAPSKIGGTRVLGVGTVELKVRRGPSADDDRMNTLILRDVLHMPQARCNGLCLGRYQQTNMVEVDSVSEEGGGEEVRVFSESESESETEIEIEGVRHGHGHVHKHGEALWYGEGYHGSSRVVLWGDPHGSEDLDNVDGSVNIPGVDASAEELDTLFARVRERALV